MKTKEFIKRVEELGFGWFGVDKVYSSISIVANDNVIARVSKSRLFCVDTLNPIKVEWINEKELFDLIVEYAKTPIEEREGPKKYYLRYKWINADYNYLNYDHRLNVYGLDRILNYNWIKNKFTLKEIEEIKEKYDTKLEDFEIVEVEE